MAKDKSNPLVANEGDLKWTTPPSPVDPEEKRKADKAVADKALKGDGPGATNEPR
jgi:hypothetical protein